MAGFVQSHGLKLVDRSGKPYDTRQLTSADVIAFYFSAHWCPPCKHFTPMLKKYVETLQAHGEHSLKVIFVSSDHSAHDMWKYVYDSHGDWLVLDYACRDAKDKLERQFQVSGIPQLVVIDPVGRYAVRDARGEVMAAASSSTQVLTSYFGWKQAAGATSAPPAQPPQAAFDEMPPGTRVRIRGLTGATAHNGTVGVVCGHDRDAQRYRVELGEKVLSLRVGNLLQLLEVRLPGAEGEAEWLDAVIADFEEESGEFAFQRGDAALPARARLGDAAGPILKAGARVAVQGLQAEAARQWNEHVGRVLEHDGASGRYLVQVSADAQLKIRPENLRVWPLCRRGGAL